ncbi:ABC transporter ATP-binding protein/permease [Oryzifoliimicrobium ureilyticus]|uniref:ABC transporter ATP-binding protein/permease n=1 Tax=Oryzifoliimicrobium ureilyticus TaxID=3113724 RepID=UPI0030762C6C
MRDEDRGSGDDTRQPKPIAEIGLFDRLKIMFAAFWASEVRFRILTLGTVLIVVILATAYATVILNRWNAPFYDAIARRDLPSFFHQLKIFAFIAGGLLLLNVLQSWLNQMTALYMREGLTRDLVDQWLRRKRAIRLAASGLIGVNPDQRLHEDARNLAESTTSLLIGLIQATILLVSFTGVLWELSSGFIFNLAGHHFSIPGYMVWAAIFYAASASVLSKVVGRRLVPLNADRFSKEAELRFSLMHANENMPAIALARGEDNERRRIDTDISSVLKVMKSLALANTNLTWVSAGYGWLVVVIPIIVAAPAYFSSNLTFGQLMMSVGAFTQVNTALRWYVSNFGPIAEWRATLMRVTDFRKALTEMDADQPLKDAIQYDTNEGDKLEADHLRVSSKIYEAVDTCGGAYLVENKVTINQGDKIMIEADHSENRKLVFNALAGLWPFGSGRLALPPAEDMAFLAEQAYVPGGSLREALAFPQSANAYQQADIENALRKSGLDNLIARLDVVARWDKMLNADEHKAIAFARLLLSKPRWIVFDETLDSLEPERQSVMMSLLGGLPESTMIYMGRSTAFAETFKPRILHLQSLQPATQAKQSAPRETAPAI